MRGRRRPAGRHPTLVVLALLAVLPLASSRARPAAGAERRDVVADLVARRGTCQHFAGEEGYSWRRRAEIAAARRRAGCDRLRDEENALLSAAPPAGAAARICAARAQSDFDHPTPAERAAGAMPCAGR